MFCIGAVGLSENTVADIGIREFFSLLRQVYEFLVAIRNEIDDALDLFGSPSNFPQRDFRVNKYGASLNKRLEQSKGCFAKFVVLAAPYYRRVHIYPGLRCIVRFRFAHEEVGKQAVGFGLERQNVSLNFLQRTHGRGLVEIAVEADFVADLHTVGLVPGVFGVGQDFPLQKGFDAAFFGERDLLGVAQVGVGLVFDHGGLAVEHGDEQAAHYVGLRAALVDFPDDARRVFAAFAVFLELLYLRCPVGAVRFGALDSQRPLDGHLPIAEIRVLENLALLVLFECEKGLADALDVVFAEFAILLAEILAQRAMPAGGVDQLHHAAAMRGFAVGQHPHVGSDAGVVEQVEGQGDDGFEPVVLDDPAADVALALAGVAGEQRTAVVYFGDAAAESGLPFHLGELVGQEQHLAVA